MDVKNLVFLFCCVLLLGINLSRAFQVCSNSGNFTTNSTYGKNLDLILSSLPANVSANGGFYNTTIGRGSDIVHVLGLCREHVSSEDCSTCVDSRVKVIRAGCPNQTEAIDWDGSCLVRYANRSFLGILELEPNPAGYNTGRVTDVISNETRFYQIWEELMTGVVERASSGTSRLAFATGIANVIFPNIHALMQCTPDLSQTDCKTCLMNSVSRYQTCCYGYQGGYVLRPSCHFRWDLYSFFTASNDTLYLTPSPPPQPPPSPPQLGTNNSTKREDNGGLESQAVAIIMVPIIILLVAVLVLACILLRRRNNRKHKIKSKSTSLESLQFSFSEMQASTDNFSEDNKLGQGGFGSVYKGRLSDGQEIAVKRLYEKSVQGDLEFKNEVLLMAKLQHRNLLTLLGFALEGKERLLIFEFLPNSSLDHFLFDPVRRLQLDWDKRHNIITGIARGILYLHEDSQYRIVHRDLKAANILLDKDMNPKIADFGMARLFSMDQTHDATSKPVGTFGYMPPEYLRRGKYSVKSDVYSFGVLVLEIIIGEKISSFRSKEGEDLLTHAWQSWKRGTVMNMIDPASKDGRRLEMMRCIHVGLLCVQATDDKRPTMTSVVLMLSSYSMSLPLPSRPAYVDSTIEYVDSTTEPLRLTVNEVSISELDPR